MRRIKKILAVTGIRSEYDILYPVIRKLADHDDYDLSVVVSGAHLSSEHGQTWKQIVSDGFKIADAIDSLISTQRETQRPKAISALVAGLSQTVERVNPDLLLVVGDREESIATAIVGNYMNVLVGHIGGGDPVWGNADDPIRMAVSKLSHLHFTTAKPYSENLQNIGEDAWRIHFCGTPGLDNIKNEPELPVSELSTFVGSELTDYGVVIFHPMSSELKSTEKQINALMEALQKISEQNKFKFVCIEPNSDPGAYQIRNAYKKSGGDRIIPVNTLPRSIFVNLMRNARVLIGNSSMGLLEAPMYQLPVVNVGNRQQGRLNAGNVKFVEPVCNKIEQAIHAACFDQKYRDAVAALDNPYGDGNSASIIEGVIGRIDLDDEKWRTKQTLVGPVAGGKAHE